MKLLTGDCVEVMRSLPEHSVDAIVCDPPYGLEFMGKEWDKLGDVRQPGDPTLQKSPGPMGRQKVRYGGYPTYGQGRTGKPGIGDRKTDWVSNRGWNEMRCRNCGHLSHGGSPCTCDAPDFQSADDRWQRMEAWHYQWAREALRVAKPGAHLVAFGGTRTSHRLVSALEDAGWEIRDSLMWCYGSGFPKSMDVSKVLDKQAGATRTVVGPSKRHGGRTSPSSVVKDFARFAGAGDVVTTPATDDAKQWSGWGTALKPAWEPIVLARKPLVGTVASNVKKYGTGALNIDACRIAGPKGNGVWGTSNATVNRDRKFNASPTDADFRSAPHDAGRWPANVVMDPEAGQQLDAQSGEGTTGHFPATLSQSRMFGQVRPGVQEEEWTDTGGASRFFYCAKASTAEREEGLHDFAVQHVTSRPKSDDADDRQLQERLHGRKSRNTHPTVKPVALMRWLCMLVTPPGGTVLDPFMGSGTTGIAARLAGFDFLGIDKMPEYVAIAEARIAAFRQYEDYANHPALPAVTNTKASEFFA